MRSAMLALALSAAGCGQATLDPVTHVLLVDELGGELGRAYWSEDGDTRIELISTQDDFFFDRRRLLMHELWHVLTRIEEHPNDDGCVSSLRPDVLFTPCPEEVAQVNEAGRVVRLSFPQDRNAAIDAARWWNDATGRECVIVVE